MVRLDATYMDEFHNVFPTAKKIGYGRLFRSPTLYEDIVKTMTNVNTTFSRTQTMNTLICQHYGTDGAFPSASTLGKVSQEDIQENCSVGYRAKRIVEFAKHVSDGTIDLNAIETLAEKYLQSKREKYLIFIIYFFYTFFFLISRRKDEAPGILTALKKRLLSIHGLGEFSANNILQLLGIDIIPSDSETARHLREHHKINLKNPKEIHHEAQKLYSKYEPYQFLVYWYNLYDFSQRFPEGFILELATPAPSFTSTSTTITSTSTTTSTPSSTTTTTQSTITVKKESKKKRKKERYCG